MFMFLVVIHELGHYFAAKKSWVFVKEFGIGIPPKAFSFGKDKAGTEWTLNWIPLGWFVRLQWEDPTDSEEFLHPASFINASLWKKIVILLWGVFVNAVFALIAFTIAFWVGVRPITIIPDSTLGEVSRSYLVPSQSFLVEQWLLVLPEWLEDAPASIEGIQPWSLADIAGIQAWEVITSIDGTAVYAASLREVLISKIWESFEVSVSREWVAQAYSITCPETSCVLWVSVAWTSYEVPVIQFGWVDALAAAWHEFRAQIDLTFNALWKLGSSFLSFDWWEIKESVDGLSGPVWIVKFGGDILLQWGLVMYLAFAGMISLALAIFNILPIPALDGWRIVGVLTQAIGRFSPQSYFLIENYINLFFFVMLMILWIYIIIKDLDRFWQVTIPFIG